MQTRTIAAAVLVLSLAVCSRAFPDDFLKTLQQAAYTEAGLVYGQGGGHDLRLDLYQPSTGEGPFPAVVFIHGGGWRAGHSGQFSRQAMYLATQGYVCVCIDYRLSGEARFPAAIEDCKCAVRWMRAVGAKEYKVDPERIAVSGESAGGHLSLLLGTSGGAAELEGQGGWAGYSSRVQLVAAFNPACRFSGIHSDAIPAFLGGDSLEVPEAYRLATPSTWIDRTDPPMLLLHGDQDKTVPYSQSVEFVDALKAAGVEAELYTEKGAGHTWMSFPPYFEPTTLALKSFLDRHFKK
ncbi:alpha/beta hydrolase [bacterium]|nr:alpha/beta hydrolase [bacterium]